MALTNGKCFICSRVSHYLRNVAFHGASWQLLNAYTVFIHRGRDQNLDLIYEVREKSDISASGTPHWSASVCNSRRRSLCNDPLALCPRPLLTTTRLSLFLGLFSFQDSSTLGSQKRARKALRCATRRWLLSRHSRLPKSYAIRRKVFKAYFDLRYMFQVCSLENISLRNSLCPSDTSSTSGNMHDSKSCTIHSICLS